MARPNRHRLMGNEHALARRVAWERERRAMSYDGLASRMTQLGCAIQGSALYKIEKGQPQRRITVDELVALAQVFELTVEDLLRPVSVVLYAEVEQLIAREDAAIESLFASIGEMVEVTREQAVRFARADQDGDDGLRAALKDVIADGIERGGGAFPIPGGPEVTRAVAQLLSAITAAAQSDLGGTDGQHPEA